MPDTPATTHGKSSNLRAAKKAKNDEFYTQLSDIENELGHYAEHFRDKTVYLNCDDPRESNFFVYFSRQFEHLGLKRLIATSYSGGINGEAVYYEYLGDKDGNGAPDPYEIDVKPMMGDGDFRSDESLSLLKEADIVVTNPPFSLFREYIAQLIEHDKKFVVLGNPNAVGLKEIFPLIQTGRLWLGNPIPRRSIWCYLPDRVTAENDSHDATSFRLDESNRPQVRCPAAWFTNLDHSKRHDEIPLFRRYDPVEFPEYDNYYAIEVSKVAEIPCDYDGVMGVPITFLDKHNPDQFEIVGIDYDVKTGALARLARAGWDGKVDRPYLNGKRLYFRILIRRKEAS